MVDHDTRTEILTGARRVLDANWRAEGYTVPNARVYPFQWLWDSCFHSIVWAALDEPSRAVSELAHLFRTQNVDGFVPHMDYEFDPRAHADLWGRDEQSCITQPPMFGHAIRELSERGIDVDELLEPATRGLRFLLDLRPRIDGLVSLCHPWESGGDNCPRWDDWCPGSWSFDAWRQRKNELVSSIEFTPGGSPIANPSFVVGSCGFSALVAFNALELAAVTGDGDLAERAHGLTASIDARWDDELRTWVDTGDASEGSGRVRVLDALLPVLLPVDRAHSRAAIEDLLDGRRFGGACGPAGVHRDEPSFDATEYWRGPAWPQLTYLFMVAARRSGSIDGAARDARNEFAAMLRDGALRSRWAEYWSPDLGEGLGAIPQSWAALAALTLDD